MQSPKDRYENDSQYRQPCDLIESFLRQARFTPSEVRECAVMACIHYEMRYGLRNYLQSVPMQVNDAFKTLDEFRKSTNDQGTFRDTAEYERALRDVLAATDNTKEGA